VPLPVVLSGGLHAANVIAGILSVRPWAVDVSSGVESAPGIKDAAALSRFCDAVRDADGRIADAQS
jgi:phosphoribosylanthranilate isomerase